MNTNAHVRWGWLKFMYIYTIIGAGGFGLAILLLPGTIQSLFRFPTQDPIVFGITGSVYAGFGLVSILGLRSPLKFAPILLLQLCYKSVWLLGVIIPLLASGRFPLYATSLLLIFVTYIIGDCIAIPFSYLFSKRMDS
jgi:hypothetical protein